MAIPIYIPPDDSALHVQTLEILGRRYEVCSITPKCHTITALATGAVRQYRDWAALCAFVEQLRWYLAWKNGLEQRRDPAAD